MPERVLTRFEQDASNPKTREPVANGSAPKSKKRNLQSDETEIRKRQKSPSANKGQQVRSTSRPSSTLQDDKSIQEKDQAQEELQRQNGLPSPLTSPKYRPQLLLKTHDNLRQRAQAFWPQRRALPIWSYVKSIRQSLRTNDILLLVGETGSGKSTQIPQMLLQEQWFKSHPKNNNNSGVRVGGCIAITQPRRVAAITLARRVAEEMGTPLGASSPASKVGYSVRFDNSTGPSTQVKFLTEGMLLQEMLRDPWLKQYSAVVVDEVHERACNVDLVLGFLKRMVVDGEGLKERGGVGLKVVVMSATAEVEKLVDFFAETPHSKVVNRVKGVNGANGVNGINGASALEKHESSSETEWSGISSDDDDQAEAVKEVVKVNGTDVMNDQKSEEKGVQVNGAYTPDIGQVSNGSAVATVKPPSNISTCYIEGRQHHVSIHYTPAPVPDFIDASLRTILQIHHSEPCPGDILVFLTGQEVVESLEALLKEHIPGLSSAVPKIIVLPLFAALPQAAQQRVFAPTPRNTRKVILATNIAETSVTVSGVRFVIDCGKAKMKQFRSRLGLDSLLVKPISRSSAIQRAGRAGREAEGKCYRLYMEQSYLDLASNSVPEILRCDLSQAILTLKARGVGDVTKFPFLSPPSREALEKALLLIYQLGALTDSGDITPVGRRMAALPLSAKLSRALIAAEDPNYECVDEVIDIISCLSVENVFLPLKTQSFNLSHSNPDKPDSDDSETTTTTNAAASARSTLHARSGDHLTLLSTLRAYLAEVSDRKDWCVRHAVSHRAMRAVLDVRKQLRNIFRLPAAAASSSDNNSNTAHQHHLSPEKETSVLKALLVGFATNCAIPVRAGDERSTSAVHRGSGASAGDGGGEGGRGGFGGYATLIGGQKIGIHPSSVLFGRQVECLMYNEYVFTNRAYARGGSAVQMDWVGELWNGTGDDGNHRGGGEG